MAKIDKNVNIPTSDASKVTKKAPIHATHITTQSFLRPSPISAIELFPNRKLDISCNSFCRLEPMPRPVMSRAKIYNRAFYVPYRTVYADFTKFIVSSPVPVTGAPLAVPGNTPFISNADLVKLLVRYSATGTVSNFDFNVKGTADPESPNGPYILSPEGVYVYKVLRSLGYNPTFNLNESYSVSLLPLYCFIKVVMDWYYPSVYAYSDLYSIFDGLFQDHGQDNPTLQLSYLQRFFDEMAFCSYDADYFVSSWDSPVAPNNTNFEASINITDITNGGNYGSVVRNFQNNAGNTPVMSGDQNGSLVSSPQRITQYVVDALRSLTDYTKRHQLAGVRAVDRYLADFGIDLSAELLSRSLYLGYNEYEINFYDVMSHADTDQASLGDFAGKGFANGSKKFSFTADEYGMFIIVNSVVPMVSIYQGTSRHVFHTHQLDFYRGDFDKLAVQGIRKCEVYVPKDGYSLLSDVGLVNQVFSFISVYAEYQTVLDLVTGRFDCNSQNADLQGFILGRDLSHYDHTAVANFKHNLDFMLALDYKIYNRIFYTEKTVEPIILANDFTIQFEDSSLPVWESYQFAEINKVVKENIGGSTVN